MNSREIRESERQRDRVSVKEFAQKTLFAPPTVHRWFRIWYNEGLSIVIREGLATDAYPEGKLITLDREAFDGMRRVGVFNYLNYLREQKSESPAVK